MEKENETGEKMKKNIKKIEGKRNRRKKNMKKIVTRGINYFDGDKK